MIPTSRLFDQSVMTALLDNDPLVQQYRAFFSFFDWSIVERWQNQRTNRGRPAHPESAYLKAFLIRQCEGLLYTSQLRRFLLKHPLLVIELGFHLTLDPRLPYGFDLEKTLPCRFWFNEKLRLLDPILLQDLLHATIADLQHEIAGLGDVVAFDVKHIYAWVQENNPRAYVKDRYDKDRQLAGDPDCKLGVKRSSNQDSSEESGKPNEPTIEGKDQSSNKKKRTKTSNNEPEQRSNEKKEFVWGYGSGVATATTPDYGDVVLAEHTLPFNEGDITYFQPLYQQAVVALHRYPTHITADAAAARMVHLRACCSSWWHCSNTTKWSRSCRYNPRCRCCSHLS